MHNNEQGIDKLKDILEKINGTDGAKVTESAEGGMEFEFSKPMPKTALVFEESGDDCDEELPDACEQQESVEQDACSEDGAAEFEFAVSEEGADGVSSSMIWKTYVPRFTDATKRSYRYLTEDEYLERKRTSGVVPIVHRAEHSTKIKSATDEMDAEAAADAVLVDVSGKEIAAFDTVNVFKFGKEKAKVAEKTPEELEKEEMDELFGRKSAPSVGEVAEADASDEITEEEVENELPVWDEESGVFNIPDPVMSVELCSGTESLTESELPLGATCGVASGKDLGASLDYASKRDKYKDKFLDMLMATRLRIFMVLFLGIALAIFENTPGLSQNLAARLGVGSHGIVSVVVDVCAVSALFMMAMPEVFRALSSLGKRIVCPELSMIIVYLGFVAYAIAAIPYADEYNSLGSAFAVMALFTVLSTYFVKSAEFRAFRLVSERGEKLVVDTRYTRTLDRENIALDGAVNEYRSKIARDFKTAYVSGFFANSAKRRENTKNNITVLSFVVTVAMALGVAGYFIKGGNLLSALYAEALVLCFGMPLFFVMSHKLTSYKLEKCLVERGSAIIGEEGCYDCAEIDVIAFEDDEIFGGEDVAFKSISLSDKSSDFRKAMKKMSSLFSAVGGPLCKVFSSSLGKRSEAASGVVVEDDGICGVVDGVTVMAGSADYMKRHGIQVPDTGSPTLASTRVMYGAEDNSVFVKFSIQYSFSEEFALMINSFIEQGITPLIYTRDPNVNNELVNFLAGGKCPIRVMKKYSVLPETKPVYKSLSSALVTVGDKTDAIDAILMAKSYVASQSEIRMFELVASVLGAIVAVALFVFVAPASINLSALVGVWHMLLGIAFYAFGRRIFKGKRKGKK